MLSRCKVQAALLVLAVARAAPALAPCDCRGLLPAAHVPVPCVCIPDCADGAATLGGFQVVGAHGGAAPSSTAAAPTTARICHGAAGISLRWAVVDANIVTTTPPDSPGGGGCAGHVCRHCHDNVWEADAVEFYMSLQPDLADSRQNVTEIDVSALDGGLWGGWVNNSDGYLPTQPNHKISPCSAAAAVSQGRFPGGWEANLTIPWSAYGRARGEPRPRVGRLNFYRWDHGLAGGGANLSAWSVPSCDGRAACNPPHVPKYFGVARLVDKVVVGTAGAGAAAPAGGGAATAAALAPPAGNQSLVASASCSKGSKAVCYQGTPAAIAQVVKLDPLACKPPDDATVANATCADAGYTDYKVNDPIFRDAGLWCKTGVHCIL